VNEAPSLPTQPASGQSREPVRSSAGLDFLAAFSRRAFVPEWSGGRCGARFTMRANLAKIGRRKFCPSPIFCCAQSITAYGER
jgi:hypothetical protein